MKWSLDAFDFSDNVIVVTGGTGVLLRPTVSVLVEQGAKVIVLSRKSDRTFFSTDESQINPPHFFSVDVTDKSGLLVVRDEIIKKYGRVDILINGAGGNQPGATTNAQNRFFDLSPEPVNRVFAVNFMGTFYTCQVFGEVMARQKKGVILNISSMAGIKPLTRVVSYSAAKAAVENFTRWLAVYMAQEYAAAIRVNALAPGFLLTEQNRFLLTDPNGALTARGQQILDATPMGRFGDPGEMIGTILWLISDVSSFVTGVSVPVDGGFAAFGGV